MNISKDKIKRAIKCLVDNGIEKDKAETVLQALGYILLDEELFPKENLQHDANSAPVLFVDLDGTLAEFKYAESMDILYEKGYFLNLRPIPGTIAGLRCFMKEHPEIEVYVLSAYLGDSKWALQEKIMWLDTYFPELEEEHQLFVKCGQLKSDVPLKNQNAFLLDDHSPNLMDWEDAGFKGIKLLNGINGKGRKWKGETISSALTAAEFAARLYDIMFTDKNA